MGAESFQGGDHFSGAPLSQQDMGEREVFDLTEYWHLHHRIMHLAALSALVGPTNGLGHPSVHDQYPRTDHFHLMKIDRRKLLRHDRTADFLTGRQRFVAVSAFGLNQGQREESVVDELR